MKPRRLWARMRHLPEGIERSDCGRPGCEGWLGHVAAVVAEPNPAVRESDRSYARLHLLERHWTLTTHDQGRQLWVAGKERHPARWERKSLMGLVRIPGEWVRGIEPNALLRCPRCQAVQGLPPETASFLNPGIELASIEVAVSRLRPLDSDATAMPNSGDNRT